MLGSMDLGVADHRQRTSREQTTQIAITLFGDAAEFVLASTRALLWHKTDPGQEVAPRSENLRISDAGDQSSGECRTDARNIVKPLAGRVRTVPSHDLAIEFENLGLQYLNLKLGTKGGNALTRHIGQALVTAISDDIEQMFNAIAPNRRNDPKFGEMAADRVDHRSLLWRV